MSVSKTPGTQRKMMVLLSSALICSTFTAGIPGAAGLARAETPSVSVMENTARPVNVLSGQSPLFAQPLTEKIMAKSTADKTLELELTGTLQLADSYTVEQTLNGQTLTRSLGDVMVGAANVTVYPDSSGKIQKILIQEATTSDRMRVGIRRDISNIADNSTFEHSQLDIKSADGFRVSDKKGSWSHEISADKTVTFSVYENQTVVKQDGTELYRTPNRLYAEQITPESSLMQIMTFKRGQGNPLYRGSLEITRSPVQDKLRLVNDITLEQYLYQVVPSEMPASFGKEALKAQAIAARTYALTDYFSSRFSDRGMHIDDSTLSQVFNNSAENELTTQAVNETAGLIMKSGNELVDARFYSTSGGFGASKHEVWSDSLGGSFPGTPIPYLVAKSYTYDKSDPSKMLDIDTSDEEAIRALYKDLSYTGYDSESLYFRWKIDMTKQHLEKTININLPLRFNADPTAILTKEGDRFVSKPIPADGIGTLTNMYAAKRGAGGNITELVIEGSTGTYKILKEFNIRFTIKPVDGRTGDIYAERAKGGSLSYDSKSTVKNPSILFSAFFTFDLAKDSNGDLTNVTFYGGGNGHAVGMSQYGASMLGGKGWKYDQILNAYYSNMQLEKATGEPFEIQKLELTGLTDMNAGDDKQAGVKATYTDGSSAAWTAGITFSSSDPAVATIDSSGLVKAHKRGQTDLKVHYGNQTGTYKLTVSAPYTAAEIAADLVTLPAVAKDATKLTLPSVPEGFKVTIKSTDKPATLNTDGTINPPAGDTTVNVVLTVTKVSDDTKADTVSIPVLVPAKTENNTGGSDGGSGSGSDGGSNGGSGGGPGPVTPPAPDTGNGQHEFKESDLQKPPVDGKVTLPVPAAAKQISIPASAVELLGASKLALQREDLTLEIPAELLKRLSDKVTAEQRKDSTFTIEMSTLSASDAQTLLSGSQTASTRIRPAGAVANLSLSILTKDGVKTDLTTFEKPVTVHFTTGTNADPALTGIYYIADNGTLEYIGGKHSPGKITAELHHFSTFAALEWKQTFADLPGTHWAFKTVEELTAKHMINGTSENTFEPQRSITRAEFTALLVRALKLSASGMHTFTDVRADEWYADSISIAVQAGIVEGKTSTTFEPQSNITRQEMVAMMMRAYNEKTAGSAAAAASFTDESEVADWALPYVKIAAELNLIDGRENGKFVPNGMSTRAEAATIIKRVTAD
ncbi:SpoIID/LytB domain-containing protein [Paenibacillus sp. FJAT-26967]|uniref:SpoIID/LytB domain-containing protein n=1 Tax=Paenibacillus sp. FJAT-26967 TaxID=1729690 RepID=UPI000837C2EE|nr:SpoIID/LytB domain-containing protein [Paenibacillus sp. FJAT-26967]